MIDGKYNIDFLELIELSTIDFHLRKLVISTMIDLEHIIKVKLMNLFDNNEIKNAKKRINTLIKDGILSIRRINEISVFDYKYDLYKKYEGKWELWALIEILPFGSLIMLIKNLEVEIDNLKNFYFPLRKLRNEAAHNSLLLCNLRNINHNFDFTKKIKYILKKNNFKENEQKSLSIPLLNDLMCMILVMYKFKDNLAIQRRIGDLLGFFDRVEKSRKIITSKEINDIFILLDRFHNVFVKKQ